MCFDAPSNFSRNAKTKAEISKPQFYPRNIMKTRNGSMVVMLDDHSHSKPRALVIASTNKDFPNHSIVTYSSEMLHLLHCKDEKRKGLHDNCFMHGLDVVKGMSESLTEVTFDAIEKSAKTLTDTYISADRKNDGEQEVKVYKRKQKKTVRFTLKPVDLKIGD